ncbi:MAG: AI-2E family transporter [Clostridia bacterium]|nr:AI-2E family transporter [Clostridia bacterium]
MREKRRSGRKWLYWFSLALSLIIIYKVLDSFSSITGWISRFFSVITPFVIGVIIAYILYIPSKKIEKLLNKSKILKKKSRGLSVFIVYVMLFAIIIMAIRFLVPPLISSFQDLVTNFQAYYVGIRDKIMALPEDSILKSDYVIDALNGVTSIKIEDYINLEKITLYAQGILSVASGVLDVFVAFVVSIYLLLERREIVEFCKRFVKANFKESVYRNVARYFRKSNEIFCGFLVGQLTDAIVVGILTSIAMSIMGVKYAVMLGLFIGIFNMIPYFGAIIAVVISIFITLLTGGLPLAVEMTIVVIILQQVDANIINPKIVGDSVKISPLLVILSVTIGGAYFGVLGMFLGVPVVGILKLFIDDYVKYKENVKKAELQRANSMDSNFSEIDKTE